MTSHGFGGGKLQSERERVNPKQKAEFARRVSKEVKYIIRAHAVKMGGYDIMFEFEHLEKYHMKPEDLMKEIQKISVDGHQMVSADFYVIESSYQRGELLREHDETKT